MKGDTMNIINLNVNYYFKKITDLDIVCQSEEK